MRFDSRSLYSDLVVKYFPNPFNAFMNLTQKLFSNEPSASNVPLQVTALALRLVINFIFRIV